MPLRSTMGAALRALRLAHGWSLEQLGRCVELGRSHVYAIEQAVAGEYVDRLERLAAALGATWDVVLVPEGAESPQRDLVREALAVPPELASELLALVRCWPQLSEDDRDLIAHLCRRRAALQDGQVIPLPARQEAPQQSERRSAKVGG